ncbi:MAG: CARDB domain-containing protein [Candidatus Sungiibacteriota bacterium]
MTASKKTIIGLHIVALFAVILSFLPLPASATVPVQDDKAIGVLKDILKVDEKIEAGVAALVKKEYKLDPAAKSLSALMLQFITKVIIGFVQQGGNTNFVSNLMAAFGDAADQAAGEFINQLAGTNLCAPFAKPIRNTFGRGIPRLSDRLSCTASDIFTNLQTSYEGFLGDFTNGGWLAYQATLSGGNNYIDALINSIDAKLLAESQRVAVKKEKYEVGSGFIGVNIKKEVCSEYNSYTGEPICNTVDIQTTPGKLVAEQLVQVFNSGIEDITAADEIGETLDKLFFFFINRLISSAQSGLASNDENSGIYDGALSGGAVQPPSPPLPPDLFVSRAPVTSQTTVLAGDIITFAGTIINTGGIAATTFSSNFQVDINNDRILFEKLNPDPVISYLAIDAEQAVTSGAWKAMQGTHRIILCADEPDSVIDELIENNNCDSRVFTVGPRPDLVISENPGIFSGEPTASSTITFKGTVKNQGGSNAAASFQNSFRIDLGNDGSTDVTLSPHPTIANLASGATQSVISANWTAAVGTHRVILCADEPSQTIIEANETNNCSPAGTGVFTISPPPPPPPPPFFP